LAGLTGYPDIQIPLFMAIFVGVAISLLIGVLIEWVREHRIAPDKRGAK
jgi:hypothetical protein